MSAKPLLLQLLSCTLKKAESKYPSAVYRLVRKLYRNHLWQTLLGHRSQRSLSSSPGYMSVKTRALKFAQRLKVLMVKLQLNPRIYWDERELALHVVL